MIGDDIPRLNDGKDDERIDRLQTFLECRGGFSFSWAACVFATQMGGDKRNRLFCARLPRPEKLLLKPSALQVQTVCCLWQVSVRLLRPG